MKSPTTQYTRFSVYILATLKICMVDVLEICLLILFFFVAFWCCCLGVLLFCRSSLTNKLFDLKAKSAIGILIFKLIFCPGHIFRTHVYSLAGPFRGEYAVLLWMQSQCLHRKTFHFFIRCVLFDLSYVHAYMHTSS